MTFNGAMPTALKSCSRRFGRLTVTIIIAFQYFYELPRIKEAQQQETVRTEQTIEDAERPGGETVAPSPPGTAGPATSAQPPDAVPSEIIESADRVDFDNGRIRGSFARIPTSVRPKPDRSRAAARA